MNTFFDKSKKGIAVFAKKIGKSPNTIYNRIYLLTLPENPIQNAIESKVIPLQVAGELSKLRKITNTKLAQEYMIEIFNEFILGDMSLGEVKERVSLFLQKLIKIDHFEHQSKNLKIISFVILLLL